MNTLPFEILSVVTPERNDISTNTFGIMLVCIFHEETIIKGTQLESDLHVFFQMCTVRNSFRFNTYALA